MRILLVYAHPNHCSFNQGLKEHAVTFLEKQQHHVIVSDLYEDKFKAIADWQDFNSAELSPQYGVAQQQAYADKLLSADIQQEQQKILNADAIILQFPLWWFSVPAILKGWLDRVLTPGFAYEKDKWFADGLLKPRKVMLALTTQSPASAYAQGGMHGDINQYLLPINHTLRFAGLTVVEPYVAYGVMAADDVTRQHYLKEYELAVLNALIKT
jgi:NAD(P)H dehydrogenase (quinone)